MPRYFTRMEAEALLPAVEPLLREIQGLRAELAEHERQARELHARALGNGHLGAGERSAGVAAATRIAEQIESLLEQITELGVLVKDLDSGLIDFPTLRDGREVYLCWRLGEGEHIVWWHEIELGFAGRQPLDE
jgi:hypothetical protein